MQSSKIKIDLRNYIVPTIPQAILLLFVVVLIWFTNIFMNTWGVRETNSVTIASTAVNFIESSTLLSKTLSLLLTALNAFFISQLNNRYSIIRTRSFLPVLFFSMLIASWHNTHSTAFAHLALSLFLVAIYVFYGIYRNRNAAEQAYTSSILVAVASLIYAPIILFIPVFWIGLSFFYSFSVRTFLATILGILTPWVLFLAIKYYIEPDLNWLYTIGESFQLGFNVLTRPFNELIYLACLTVIAIIGLVGVTSNINQDSMQARALLNFNTLLLFFSFAFTLIFPQMFFVFLPFVAMSYAILLSHPITIGKTEFYKIIFIVFIVLNIAYVVSNIIMHPL